MCNKIEELAKQCTENDIVKRLFILHENTQGEVKKTVADAMIYITKLRLDLGSGKKGKNG